MTKTLIAFASKTGTAKEAAEILSGLIPGSVLVDLEHEQPDPTPYDLVIVGGGVRMGRVHKLTERYIAENKSALMDKDCAFFITNMFIDSVREIITGMLPLELKDHAVICASFGGRLDIDKLKGSDKIIAKMVEKSKDDSRKVFEGIDQGAIRTFAAEVQA